MIDSISDQISNKLSWFRKRVFLKIVTNGKRISVMKTGFIKAERCNTLSAGTTQKDSALWADISKTI